MARAATLTLTLRDVVTLTLAMARAAIILTPHDAVTRTLTLTLTLALTLTRHAMLRAALVYLDSSLGGGRAISPVYLPYISLPGGERAGGPPGARGVSAAGRAHRGARGPYISPISPLYLPYISPIPPLYLPYISPISP